MAFFLFSALGCVFLFLFGLSLTTARSTPISYADAAQRYHFYFSGANDNKVALTIDDGPNPEVSKIFLDTLEKYDTPVTFFYIGKLALARPDLVKEASERGFDVENHSFTHGQEVQSSYNRLAFEINATGYLLNNITDKKQLFYRPPFLISIGVDPTINPYIAPSDDLLWSLKLGYLPIGADIDPKEWLSTSTDEVLAGLNRAFHDRPNGHIILLHEDLVTSKALPQVIVYLHKHGYSIVPLSELLTPPQEISLASTLTSGDTDKVTGGAVSMLQWFLYTQKYLDPYDLSGVFDEQTRSALQNFQIQNKLLDPSNPDPRVSGIANAATRKLIHSISLNAAPKLALAPEEHLSLVGTAWILTAGALGSGVRSLYINVFPLLTMALFSMTIFTLVLVVARTLGLISLIAWGKLNKKPELVPDYSEPNAVTILIPAYNEQQNIGATVESVIRTSYQRREIIVIDDGSKDDTSGEVEAIIRAYPNDQVRLVRTENGGKASALNIGIAHAKNDIIVVLDADAVLEKDAIAHFVKHFTDTSVGAVAGKVCTTGSHRMLDLFQTLEYAIGQNIDKRAFSTIGAVGIVPGPAGAWRRSYILALGGFSTETLAEDQDMTLTLLRSGSRIVYEPLAIAYTETPHNVKNFLKQRFRWVYGTMQCFWKHKGVARERPFSSMTLVVLPNVFIYNILLPLVYPFADAAFVFGLVFGELRTLLIPFLLFTSFDMAYALWGVWREPGGWRLIAAVPLQRVVYRQLLYWSVMKSVVRALEGTGSVWNKFTKVGETRRFYFSSMLAPTLSPLTPAEVSTNMIEALHSQLVPEEVSSMHGSGGGSTDESGNLQGIVSLSMTNTPTHFGPSL